MRRKIYRDNISLPGRTSLPFVLVSWAEALPNAELVLIPDASHFPQVEQPELFFRELERFLMQRN